MREMEKRIIREEILTGLLRRRELEEEIMRELILEGYISMMRSEGSLLGLEGGRLLNGENGLEDRLVGNHSEGGVTDTFPFQSQPGVTNETAVKPLINLRKGMVMPMFSPAKASASGTKRKIETPVKEVGDETASSSKAKKSKHWGCELCQVTINSEQGLEEHFRGKKHLTKERASKITTKPIRTNLDCSHALPEVTENPIQLAASTGKTFSTLGSSVIKKVEAQNVEDVRKLDGGFSVEENSKVYELKKCNMKFKFWCEMCKVGATSEANMIDHRKGKKHTTLLKKTGGNVIVVNNMPGDAQYVDATRKGAANDGGN